MSISFSQFEELAKQFVERLKDNEEHSWHWVTRVRLSFELA
jgi:hypothetical protein